MLQMSSAQSALATQDPLTFYSNNNLKVLRLRLISGIMNVLSLIFSLAYHYHLLIVFTLNIIFIIIIVLLFGSKSKDYCIVP
jgi:hypothetical protein